MLTLSDILTAIRPRVTEWMDFHSTKPGAYNHSLLSNLDSDDHGQYLTAIRHADVPHPGLLNLDSHLAIGNASPHHSPVSAGTGIGVSGQQVSVDQAFSPTWTGTHAFQNTVTTRSIVPETVDTYDLGSSLKLWRQAYISQLNAVVFAENTVQLLGGWFIVPKHQGTLGARLTGSTPPYTVDLGVDLGAAFPGITYPQFVLIRAHDESGSAKAEYLSLTGAPTGTVYPCSRDLASVHDPNPDWPEGTPWLLLGNTDDGRIEINAQDTPRISMVTQGNAYNVQTEVLRLGDLSDIVDTTLNPTGYGLYSDNAYLKGSLVTGGGNVRFDADGISIVSGNNTYNRIGWKDGANTVGEIWGQSSQIGPYYQRLSLGSFLRASANQQAYADLSVYIDGLACAQIETAGFYGAAQNNFIALRVGSDIMRVSNTAIEVLGALTVTRSEVNHTGYIYVPFTPASPSGWDGTQNKTTGTYTLDLSALDAKLASAKAVHILVSAAWAASNNTYTCFIRPAGGSVNYLILRSRTDAVGGVSVANEDCGIVACDANGDIDVVIGGATANNVVVRILGYYV